QLSGEPQAASRAGHGVRTGAGVHAAGVRGDLDAAFHQQRQDPLHQGDEVLGVAERRIARLLLLQDGHGDFGEVVHHEVVDRPTGHLAVRGFEPVAPKTLSGRDADGRGRRQPPRRHGCGTTRRTASAPTPACTRSSTSGAKPSGSASWGGRWGATTVRPPGTTVTSAPSPNGRPSRNRKRTRTVACQGRAPPSRAKAGNNSTVTGRSRNAGAISKPWRPTA